MFWRSKPSKKEKSAQEEKDSRRNKSLEEWQSLVEERLNEAIERGEFDNLPGAGKPLNLGKNPNEPHELRMAHNLLKNNNMAPAWILDRRQLVKETETLRDEMTRKWLWSQSKLAEDDLETQEIVAYQWQLWIKEWEEQIIDLNRRILNFNLTLPIWRMELLRINLDRELERMGAAREIGPVPPHS